MSTRPMSDRHHDPATDDHPFEVRLAEPRAAGDSLWRSVAFTADYDDALQVAAALVAASGSTETSGDDTVYAEVWGPGADERSHRGVLARLPAPDKEEQRQMWLEAAGEHFSEGYSDLRR